MSKAESPISQRASRRHHRRRRLRRRLRLVVAVVVVAGVVVLVRPAATRWLSELDGHSAAAVAKLDIANAAAISPLRGRIVAIAEGQVGYRTSPSATYCNKYSAYWVSGANDCANANRDEQWCADFAAWAWKMAGVAVTYQYISGDLNSSSASFYEWGVANGTWHAAGSGYTPLPGDVAVYGLNVSQLVAQHVAVVVSYSGGSRGPDAINGDGDRTGFSVVELANDEYRADGEGGSAALWGYVAPS
jgi:hypothetical protein